jgi:hypothetical protein
MGCSRDISIYPTINVKLTKEQIIELLKEEFLTLDISFKEELLMGGVSGDFNEINGDIELCLEYERENKLENTE